MELASAESVFATMAGVAGDATVRPVSLNADPRLE